MEAENYDELVKKYDDQTKLDIACWVMSKVDEFGHNPGSFRYFIYHLLGFGPEGYVPLYLANAMSFTNEFDYSFKEQLRELVESEKIDSPKLKNFIGLCDTSGCYESASCGTPSEDKDPKKYRWTCSIHRP
jgi:hypothetical protein